MVKTGKEKTIALPSAVDLSSSNAADLKIIRDEEVKTIQDSLKKGYAALCDQCSQEVRNKLEVRDNWDKMQRDQSLHKLIQKIERICVGFNNHKQEVFNLVQVLKMLFLFTQGEKDTMDEYGRNFRSLWDTVEAFGGSPGIHKGLVDGLLKEPGQVADPANITANERRAAEEETNKLVKAALLISGAEKQRYGKLKDKLANNYLLGTGQYPDMHDKAIRILGNYQTMKLNMPFRRSKPESSLAFIQRGGRGGQGCGGRGRGAGRGEVTTSGGADTGGGGGDTSTMTGGSRRDGARTNSQGNSHCYNCGGMDHWAYKCLQMTSKQQAQLHMNVEGNKEAQEQEQEGHQLLNVTLTQGTAP